MAQLQTPTSQFAIETFASGSLWNYGSLDGGYFDNGGYQVVTVYNAGTLSGTLDYNSHDAFFGGDGSDNETIDNTGSIVGDVTLSSAANNVITNSGSIVGNVALGTGENATLQSANGSITGTITCGAGGDVVIAGQTGAR